MTQGATNIPAARELAIGKAVRRRLLDEHGLTRVLACAAIVVGFVGSIAVRVPRLTESLWYDEYCRTLVMLNRTTVVDRLLHDVHNPAYNAIMWVWISVFGDSAVSIRMPSVIAGYLSVWLVWLMVNRWAGCAMAWAVAGWMVFAPMFVWYSTEAKNNMCVVAAAMFAVWANLRMVESPTGRRVWGAIAAGSLAVYTDFATLLVLVPLGMWIVWEGWRAKEWRLVRAVGKSTAGVCLCMAPLVAFKASRVDELWRDYLRLFRAREAVELLGGDFLTGNVFTPEEPWRWWAAVGGCCVAILLLVIGSQAAWRARFGRCFVWVFVGGIVGMALVSVAVDGLAPGHATRVYQPRNLLAILPTFGVLVVYAAWRRSRVARFIASASVVGLNIAASVVMVTVNADRWTVEKPRPDWAAIGRAIERDAGRPARVISRSPVMPIDVYTSTLDVTTTWGEPIDLTAVLASAPGNLVYYVDDRFWWPEDPARLEGWRREVGMTEVVRIGSIVVYRVAGATAGADGAGR